MKIERIAENALKIYISKKELTLRNLDADTLKEGTTEYSDLLFDAVNYANVEFGHEFEVKELHIANKPDNIGGIVFTIAHDVDEDYQDNMFYDEADSLIVRSLENIFKDAVKQNINNIENSNDLDANSCNHNCSDKNGCAGNDADEDEFNEDIDAEEDDDNGQDLKNHIPNDSKIYFQGIYDKIRMKSQMQTPSQLNSDANKGSEQRLPHDEANIQNTEPMPPAVPKIKTPLSLWDVLIFPNLNDLLEFFSRNKAFKLLSSSLYFYRGAYYLALKADGKNVRTLHRLEALAIDYNATYLPAESFLPLLKERGNLIMEKGAISKLIKYFEL